MIVVELIGLNLAWMLALAVPMAVLVATLMAFGRLGADFEITAIKASGINLIHVMIPLLIAASLITYGMVQFSDKVLPDLNKRARTLMGDIRSMRPTLILESGIFITDIPGYLVLIDEIDHATSFIEGVRITVSKDPANPKMIVAQNGFLKMTDNGSNMRFSLNDGEIHTFDMKNHENYRIVDFRSQIINVPTRGSELVRSESEYRSDREMGIHQMQKRVDQAVSTITPLRTRIDDYLEGKFEYLFSDSFLPNFPDSTSCKEALGMVKRDASVMVRHVERNQQQIHTQRRVMAKYDIEIHKKYSIPAACLAFILVGAPLGMMTRRGGMGVAIALSILMFIVYWAFLIGGEDIADRGIVSPFWAMWSANILIGAVGLYLTYVVVNEKPIFNWFRRRGE